jgi:hypothetical protein
MLEPWANTTVIAAIGVGLGGVCALIHHVMPKAYEDVLRSRREGEGFLEGTRRRSEEQAVMTATPELRPFRFAAGALYALVAVLVLTVILSPVDLGWWTLLISVVAGWMFVELAFGLAKAGKLEVRGPKFLDPYA